MWITPQEHDAMAGLTPPGRVGRYGTKHGGRDLVDQAQEWQTPSVADTTGGHLSRGGARKGEPLLKGQAAWQSRMWATPNASMSEKDRYNPSQMRRHSPGLQAQANANAGSESLNDRRILNPLFVEWLQGVPIGWSDLEPLEMAWYRTWQRQRGENS
jgi:hypothetical protein